MVLQNKHNKCVTVPHEEFCILICLSVETQLNRLWTSCSTSAEHHRGHHHLSEHTSSYLTVERRTAAWSHYVKRPESDKVTLDINKTRFTDCALKSSNYACLQQSLCKSVFLKWNVMVSGILLLQYMWCVLWQWITSSNFHSFVCASRSLLWTWSASALGWTKTWVLTAPF